MNQSPQRPLNNTDKAVLLILAVLLVIFVGLCLAMVNVRWDLTR